MKFSMILKSSGYLSGISQRIAASSTRVRVLGLVIAESLSALVDPESKRLKFDMEETQSEESKSLSQLCKIQDSVGSIEPLRAKGTEETTLPATTTNSRAPKPKKSAKAPVKKSAAPSLIMEVEELGETSEEDIDEDFSPLPKGHDPEDSDDDPTMIQRNKTKPPVYIRDLISYFKASDDYDKQSIALRTAPGLVRRKATFGTELDAHAQELAGAIVGLHDNFEIEEFGKLRLDSIVSLIVSAPKKMAPWFARSFFEGYFSLAQRSSILIALGLSARELAGLAKSEYEEESKFPSKRLPSKIEAKYLGSPEDSSAQGRSITGLESLPQGTRLDSIVRSITSSFLGPLAANAADAVSGPDALKLKTVSEHYKSKKTGRAQVRRFNNTSASVLAESFYFPLVAWFQNGLKRSRKLLSDSSMVSLYLQTLGVIIHAAGPSTIPMPQMTTELFDLLLALRVAVRSEQVALRGWLIALASALEVNQDRLNPMCSENGQAVVELRDWVSQVFEGIRGEDGGEEDEVKMLAAGVLIKFGEAMEEHQRKFRGMFLGE